MVEAEHREPTDGLVVVVRGELVEQRTHVVDQPGMLPGQELERDQRRTAAGRALVLEAAPEELGLLAEPELADGAVRDGTLAVVRSSSRGFELVLPARSQVGEVALRALSGELVRLCSGCGQVRQRTATGARARRSGRQA